MGVLALAVLLGAALLDAAPTGVRADARASPVPDNPIIRENLRPGSHDWQRPNPPKHASTGATSAESEAQGASGGGLASWEPDLISAYADRVRRPRRVARYLRLHDRRSLRSHRQPHGLVRRPGRAVDADGLRPARPGQPIPPPDPDTGLIAATWQRSYALTVGPDWPSGIYLVRLLATTADLDVGYVVFVVRDDGQIADYVYKVAVNTYQAYNNWGGKSLYRLQLGRDRPR